MIIGFDAGRHSGKVVGNGATSIFPAYAVPYDAPLFGVNGLGGSPDVLIGWQGKIFTVGEGAVRQGDGARPEADSWIGTPEYRALFYRAISDLVPDEWFQCNVVAGLPIGAYRRDSEKLRGILEGPHTFRRGYVTTSMPVVNVVVEHLRIVPQAWGAVLALLLHPDGQIADADLLDKRLAVVDIGGHTVNLLTVKGLSDIPAESTSLAVGAWDVVRAVRQFLTGIGEGYTDLNDHEVMRAILRGSIGDVDLHRVAQPQVEHIGRTINENARIFWHDGKAFDKILLIGGGAYLWADTIRQAFPQVEILPKPETVNARAFAAFGAYLEREGLWQK